MSRVWRHFFKNLALPAAAVAYLVAVSMGAAFADSLVGGGGAFAVIFVFMILPMLAYVVIDMWHDAKEKVDRENREMMRTLKGSKYDF